jgi:PAS domain S-box-containing protein
VLVSGAISLAESLLGFEMRLSQWLSFREGGSVAGRGAGLCLLLVGSALLIRGRETARDWNPDRWASLAAALVALFGTLGAPLFERTRTWEVAPHVALVFLLFSFGTLISQPEHRSGGSILRRVVVVSAIVLSTLIALRGLIGVQSGFLFAACVTVVLSGAVWRIAIRLHEREVERQWFVEALKRSHQDLEDQVEQQAIRLRQAEEALAGEERERRRVQLELERTRHELSDVFENRLLGLRWVAPDGIITRANNAELDMLGYSEDEYIGHHISEFYVDHAAAEEMLKRIDNGEIVAGHESRLRAKDGSVRYVQVNLSVFREEDHPAGTLFVTCDVTERKRIEYELAQLLAREHAMRAMAEDAEMRYHNFVHGLDAIVWEADATSLRFTFVSRRAEAILGYPIQRWLREPEFWMNIIHPDDRERAVGLCRIATEEGRDNEFEYRAITADGREVWLHDKVYVVRDEEGGAQRLRGLMVDITGRKRAEDERALLLISEQGAREEAERAAEMVRRLQGVADIALSHLGLDDMLSQMLGRVRELLRTDSAVIMLVSEDGKTLIDRAAVGIEQASPQVRTPIGYGVVGRIAAERTPLIVNDVTTSDVIAPSLRHKARSLIGAPLIIEDRVIGVVHTHTSEPRQFTDDDVKLLELAADRLAMTIERARLYEAEQRARVDAENANRIKDEFLATLSHELRSPLNAILGWVVLLRQGKLDDEATARALETVEFSARSQNRMINDLLDVSRIISGKLRLSVRPLKPFRVIEAAVEALRPAAQAKGIVLEVELDSGSGPISADSDRLQQIVWNLVSNAIRFTPRLGTVGVRLHQTNSSVEIIVADTGVGIAPEFLPFVFDRFRQADSSSKRKQGGLGIGLAIVRHLVELQGGTVEAQSSGEGHGATFVVRFPPVNVQLAASEQAAASSKTDNNGSPAEKRELRGIRVLVVDDESGARDLVASILGPERVEVRMAASVNEALAILGDWVPDVVLSDIEMPDADGYALIHQLRSLPDDRSRIPAVALTAYARAEDRTRAMAAGFQVHIAKPIEPVQLLSALAGVLRRTNRVRATPTW